MGFKKFIRLLVFLFIFISCGLIVFQYTNQIDTEDAPLPTELHPIVKQKMEELIQLSANQGINVVITDDFRSFAEQDAIYAQGRTEAGDIVTQAQGGESFHNYGLAIDFALLSIDGQVIWDMQYDGNGNSQPDWLEVVDIAKSLEFEWGGDWTGFKDYPHLEINFGLSIRDLQRGEMPPEVE